VQFGGAAQEKRMVAFQKNKDRRKGRFVEEDRWEESFLLEPARLKEKNRERSFNTSVKSHGVKDRRPLVGERRSWREGSVKSEKKWGKKSADQGGETRGRGGGWGVVGKETNWLGVEVSKGDGGWGGGGGGVVEVLKPTERASALMLEKNVWGKKCVRGSNG